MAAREVRLGEAVRRAAGDASAAGSSARAWTDRRLFKFVLENFGLLPITEDSHFGEYLRGGHSLPPLTGPWKACIGFPPRVTGNDPDLSKYEDCVDFVLAGPGSIGARPTIGLPPAPLRAGRDLPIDYAAMPPCNCRIALHDAAGRLVASHQTSRLPAGRWITRVDAPGRYELRISYLGDAVRAHMTLDVER